MSTAGHIPNDFQREADAAAESAYRDHIARVVLGYVDSANREAALAKGTAPGGEQPLVKDAVQQLMEVTGMSLSTVRNWFRRKTGMPDLASMARIVSRWGIQPDEVFPPSLIDGMRLSGSSSAAVDQSAPHSGTASASADAAVLLPSGRNDVLSVKAALQRYSANPESLIFLRQEGTDATGVVEHGELMLVDASVERIVGSGFYVVRIAGPGGRTTVALRMVQALMGKQAVKVSAASQSLANLWEEVPLNADSTFQDGITVLGRLLAVLRSL